MAFSSLDKDKDESINRFYDNCQNKIDLFQKFKLHTKSDFFKKINISN